MTTVVTSETSNRLLVFGLAFLLAAPLCYAIVTGNYLAAGFVLLVLYIALCFIKIDAAIMCYLFIAASGINFPEFEQLQYMGLILANVLLGILVLAVVAHLVMGKRGLIVSPLNRPLFTFFGIYALYTFWSTGPRYPELLESLRYTKGILVFPLLYWIVLNSSSVELARRARYYLIGFMLISIVGALHALWKYGQILSDFTVTYWNDQRINRGEALGETFFMTCVLAILVLMYYVMQTRGDWRRRSVAVIAIGMFAVTNMAFLFRAGTAAMIVAMAIFVILLKRSRSVLWLLVVGAVLVGAFWMAPQILMRAESTYGVQKGGVLGFDPSFATRKDYLWPLAFSLIKENFLWGIGYENFRRIAGQNVHNQFIYWLVELGIVGFAAGLWFYAKICLLFWRRFLEERDEWAKTMAIASLCLMLSTLVWLQAHDFFLYGWLYYPLAFAAVLARKAHDERTLAEC